VTGRIPVVPRLLRLAVAILLVLGLVGCPRPSVPAGDEWKVIWSAPGQDISEWHTIQLRKTRRTGFSPWPRPPVAPTVPSNLLCGITMSPSTTRVSTLKVAGGPRAEARLSRYPTGRSATSGTPGLSKVSLVTRLPADSPSGWSSPSGIRRTRAPRNLPRSSS
jgi:hypothetical protein